MLIQVFRDLIEHLTVFIQKTLRFLIAVIDHLQHFLIDLGCRLFAAV